MVEDASSLVLEHLGVMRADVHEIKETLREHGPRFTRIEASIAALRREQASDAENVVHLEAIIDRLNNDIVRIKQRLEIID